MKSPLMRAASTAIAALCLFLLPVACPAAFDAFIKIEGVKGEATDANHKEWIDVLSFQHGVSQPAVTNTSGGRSAGRAVHEPLTVCKFMDSTSPWLNLYLCQGKHIPSVKLDVCDSSPEKRVYYTITLKDVIITSVSVSAPTSDTDARARETLSFSYSEITWEYKPASGGPIRSAWSVLMEKEL